jgi:hypothetical protein
VRIIKVLDWIGLFGIGAAFEAAVILRAGGEKPGTALVVAVSFLMAGCLFEHSFRAWSDNRARAAASRGRTRGRSRFAGFARWLIDIQPFAGAACAAALFLPGYQTSWQRQVAVTVSFAAAGAGGIAAAAAVLLAVPRRADLRREEERRLADERQEAQQKAQREEREARRRAQEARRQAAEQARKREEEARAMEEKRTREAEERALALRRADEIVERARQREAEEMASLVQGANLFAGGNAKQTLTVKRQIGGSEVVLSAEYDPHAAEHAERHAQLEALQRRIDSLTEREENNRQLAQIDRERDRNERDRQEWSYRQALQAIADRAERVAAEQQHQMRVLQDQADIDRRRQALDRDSDQLRRDREDVQRRRDDLAREIKAAEERAALNRKIDELTADNERLKARDDAQQQLQQQLRDIPESQW